MPTDLFKQVLYSDGEGVTHGDTNDNQRFLESKIWDQILHNSIGRVTTTGTLVYDPEFGGQDGANHPTNYAYCINPGAAYLRQGSANSKIQIAPGTLLQKIASQTGDDPTFISYTFAGSDEWTLTNGDGTNPRVDLLQMKLEYISSDVQLRDFKDASTGVITSNSVSKKRRVQCTLLVKVGTPAASPAIPTPDTGYVPIGMAVVGNGWTTGGNAPIFGTDTTALNNVVIMDMRWPVRTRAYRVQARDGVFTSWTLSSAGDTLTAAGGGTNDLFFPCPAGNVGKIVAIGVHHTTTLSASMFAGMTTGVPSSTFNNRMSLSFGYTSADEIQDWDFMTHSPSAGPTISRIAQLHNVPLWTNGKRCPFEKVRLAGGGGPSADQLWVRFQNFSTGNIITGVTFYVAEGF